MDSCTWSYQVPDHYTNIYSPESDPGSSSVATFSAVGGSLAGPISSGLSMFKAEGNSTKVKGECTGDQAQVTSGEVCKQASCGAAAGLG